MKHVVMFSGGVASWGAARRIADIHGPEGMVLLFCDTKMEDEDLYRFIDEAAADIGGELVRIADGRTPWQVFRDVRFLGNHRIDPCSRILKRELADRWVREHCDPEETTIYLGLDWTELHRWDATRARWPLPWKVEAPLTEKPYISRWELLEDLRSRGIRPPRLYELGFPHNNCGGFCIKAGQAHFARLLAVMPERYTYHEGQEEALREYLGKDVAIMDDRSGGNRRPLTLRELRERIQAGSQPDLFDWGGCGCFVDTPESGDPA